MQLANLSSQLTFLIFICFSFFIFIFNISMNKEKSYLKLFGLAFIIPLSLNVASFLLSKEMYSKPLNITSEISILVVLVLILTFKPGIRKYEFVSVILFVTPLVLFLLVYFVAIIREYITLIQVNTSLILLAALICMILLMKKKGAEKLLIWAMFSEALRSIIKYIGSSASLNLITTVLTLLTFSLFLIYFYREINTSLMKIVDEADKRLAAVNKTLDLEVKKRVFQIELSNEKLVTISKTDSLTKALNKAGIMDKIDSLINIKKNKEFCILMFDIDNFKLINDALGHITGDLCLKKLSLLAKESIRDIDTLGRYGGDEFIITLPNATVTQAIIIAERFRKNVSSTASPHFTISMGIAYFPQDGTTVKDLIAVADKGLYASKEKGKNAVSYKERL